MTERKLNRTEFLQLLLDRGGYSELTEPPGKALRKLEADGFVTFGKYARRGFEMVRVDNVAITEAGRLAMKGIELLEGGG